MMTLITMDASELKDATSAADHTKPRSAVRNPLRGFIISTPHAPTPKQRKEINPCPHGPHRYGSQWHMSQQQ